ncbi:MAG: Ig-like domain-containing protein [Myxococcota bacterium]
MRWAFLLLGLSIIGCGDDAAPADAGQDAQDAARDSGEDTGVDTGPRDAGTDTFRVDAGPPVTGCELMTPDAGPDAGGAEPPAPLAGPGGPARAFTADEILTGCASLDGGERDRDHHNTVLMLDGYLWMPWAHEAGIGGISVWDFSDPCAPDPIATVVDEAMRETHAAGIAYLQDRRWMVTTSLTGIMFWDITDPENIVRVTDMTLPEVVYPDSYARVVMSTFWQAPYVYVGASDNGVFIVDASNPESPELVHQFEPIPDFRVGGVHVIGTMLVVFPSEGSRTQLFDVSDPSDPRPIPGGSWTLTNGENDRFGRPLIRGAYFAHVNGNRAYYARHLLGGGLIVYDILDPSTPTFLGALESTRSGANGGYVFLKEDEAFLGLSRFGEIIDVRDPTNLSAMSELEMTGDLDTMVPVGNVIVASVDDDAVPGEASRVYPWKTDVDTRAPVVNMVVPRDGEERVALGARVGITFDEHIELQTLHAETFFVRAIDEEGAPVGDALRGHFSGQEGVYNFWPSAPLLPDTRYEVVVPADGVQDWNGNATATPFQSTFRTVSCE